MDDDMFVCPSDTTTSGVKYLGSKKKILNDIGGVIYPLRIGTAIDVFAGTTRVAQYLRRQNIKVVTSDLAWATECYSHTYVCNHDNAHLARFVAEMNKIAPVYGWLSDNYTGDTDQTAPRGDGRCFQLKNTMKADAVRDWIETLPLKPWEKMTLITSVIHALDAVDNTVGVQQAYLKEWCSRSHHEIEFKLPVCHDGPIGQHIGGDALQIDYPASDLAYLDPPYSPHSYATYYHIWDSIAKWDKPATALKAKRRVDRVARHADYDDTMRSLWNSPKQAIKAFDDLIYRLPVRYVLISYNDESLVSQQELEEVCVKHGSLDMNLIKYNRNIMSQIGNAELSGDVKKNQTNHELLMLIDKSFKV